MSQKPSLERAQQLSLGQIETKNLMDGLAIDFNVLLGTVFPKHTLSIDNTLGITKRMHHAAHVINDTIGFGCYDVISQHACDTIRGIAAYLLALQNLPLNEQLSFVRSLADDPHFGVREWAWIALRPAINASLDDAIQLLMPWVIDESMLVQRFAVEITRPRGVWCAHIQRLKDQPWHGLPLLEFSYNTPHKYLQDSVANWLNDASKSQPDWVVQVCDRWKQVSPTPATLRICKRARRTLTKAVS